MSSKGTPRAASRSRRRAMARASAASPGAVRSSTESPESGPPPGASNSDCAQAREIRRRRRGRHRAERGRLPVHGRKARALGEGRERSRAQALRDLARQAAHLRHPGDGGQELPLEGAELRLVDHEHEGLPEPRRSGRFLAGRAQQDGADRRSCPAPPGSDGGARPGRRSRRRSSGSRSGSAASASRGSGRRPAWRSSLQVRARARANGARGRSGSRRKVAPCSRRRPARRAP